MNGKTFNSFAFYTFDKKYRYMKSTEVLTKSYIYYE